MPSRTFRISAAWQNIRLCKEVVQMFGTSILYHNCEIKHNCSKMYSKLRCFFRNVVFGAPAHGNTSKFLAVFAWWDNMYCSGKFCQTVPKMFVLSTHWTLQISELKKKKKLGGALPFIRTTIYLFYNVLYLALFPLLWSCRSCCCWLPPIAAPLLIAAALLLLLQLLLLLPLIAAAADATAMAC